MGKDLKKLSRHESPDDDKGAGGGGAGGAEGAGAASNCIKCIRRDIVIKNQADDFRKYLLQASRQLERNAREFVHPPLDDEDDDGGDTDVEGEEVDGTVVEVDHEEVVDD